MRAALVELDTAWEDPAANRARIRGALENVQADAAILPEMAFSGFSVAAPADPDAEPFLRALARERGLALVAGHVGEGPRNTAVAVDASGVVLARYAKLQPFALAREREHLRGGARRPLFALGGMRAAMLICYDLRFPEAFREAALGGAELFLVLANWTSRRIDHWRTLLRARAIENQAYVLGVNRTGRDPHETYASSSLAVGPKGETLLEGPGVVQLDPRAVREWRAEFPALRDIRSDRYPFLAPGS
mgnify:FL=1